MAKEEHQELVEEETTMVVVLQDKHKTLDQHKVNQCHHKEVCQPQFKTWDNQCQHPNHNLWVWLLKDLHNQ